MLVADKFKGMPVQKSGNKYLWKASTELLCNQEKKKNQLYYFFLFV